MSGRVEELLVLEAARRRAADADPAVVLVRGEAGVGKIRLITELDRSLRQRRDTGACQFAAGRSGDDRGPSC